MTYRVIWVERGVRREEVFDTREKATDFVAIIKDQNRRFDVMPMVQSC